MILYCLRLNMKPAFIGDWFCYCKNTGVIPIEPHQAQLLLLIIFFISWHLPVCVLHLVFTCCIGFVLLFLLGFRVILYLSTVIVLHGLHVYIRQYFVANLLQFQIMIHVDSYLELIFICSIYLHYLKKVMVY